VADFATGHSLVAALRQAGLKRLFVTDWRSATSEMRFLGVDDYLAELNVVVDEIGDMADSACARAAGWRWSTRPASRPRCASWCSPARRSI
jgi:poly(3-hydroxyalkanoate) synthetase